jgi:hypothetical protein
MTMDDRIDELLRQTLSAIERPQSSPGFADEVLRCVAARPADPRPGGRAARLLMAAYWLASGAGVLWLLWRLPAPAWGPTAAAAVAVVLVPAGFALYLWPASAASWLVLLLRPLLTLPREGRETGARP